MSYSSESHGTHDLNTPSPASGELASLVESINYRVNNPSAWPEGFDEESSELFRLAASQLAAVAAERDALREALTMIASGKDKDGRAVDFFQDVAGEALAAGGGEWVS